MLISSWDQHLILSLARSGNYEINYAVNLLASPDTNNKKKWKCKRIYIEIKHFRFLSKPLYLYFSHSLFLLTPVSIFLSTNGKVTFEETKKKRLNPAEKLAGTEPTNLWQKTNGHQRCSIQKFRYKKNKIKYGTPENFWPIKNS